MCEVVDHFIHQVEFVLLLVAFDYGLEDAVGWNGLVDIGL